LGNPFSGLSLANPIPSWPYDGTFYTSIQSSENTTVSPVEAAKAIKPLVPHKTPSPDYVQFGRPSRIIQLTRSLMQCLSYLDA